jgi:hypothetical protein
MRDARWSEVPRVLYLTTNIPDPCTVWRCWWPCYELAQHGYIAEFMQYGDMAKIEALLSGERYTTVVTPRMTFLNPEDQAHWLEFIERFRPRLSWWYDLDDDLLSPSFSMRQAEVTRAMGGRAADLEQQSEFQRRSRVELVQHSDGVTVGNPYLASVVHAEADMPVLYVPNGIDGPAFQQSVSVAERTVPYLTIGWSGGPRLEYEIAPLYEVWPEVARRCPNVHFMLQGWAPDSLARLLPPERTHVIGGVAFEQYPASLVNIDIFCCAAVDDPFVQAKTPIKFFEATLAGAVCVASEPVYGSVISHGHTGVIAHSTEEWVRYLEVLVNDASLRSLLQHNAKQQVLACHTIAKTYPAWLDAWASSLANGALS